VWLVFHELAYSVFLQETTHAHYSIHPAASFEILALRWLRRRVHVSKDINIIYNVSGNESNNFPNLTQIYIPSRPRSALPP
jgi:hypothetical protein